MKQFKEYRIFFLEYAIFFLKAVSHTIFLYSCLYMISRSLFSIDPGKFLLYMGILTVLMSLILNRLLKAKAREQFLEKYFLASGILLSAFLGLIVYFTSGSIPLLLSAILYNTYLWKLGCDLGDWGIDYGSFRQQFLDELKVLIPAALVSVFVSLPLLSQTLGQYTAAYIIIGPVILRYSRDMLHTDILKSRRANMMNILTIAFVVLALLLVTSEGFLTNVSIFLGYIGMVVDTVLSFLVYLIAYPVGYLVSKLFSFIMALLGSKLDILNQDEINPNKALNPPAGSEVFIIPDVVITVLKIIVPAVLVIILIKFIRRGRIESKGKDFSETREFVFSLEDVRRGLKKGLSSLSSLFRRKASNIPVTIEEKVRFIYSGFLEICKEKRIYRKSSQTHRNLEHSCSTQMEDRVSYIKDLTKIYEKARYGNKKLEDADYTSAAEDLMHIKEERIQD